MKFAREFRESLKDYPDDWIESAIPYGVLKKCIKRVHQELGELGLEPSTLRQLLTAQTTSSRGDAVPLAKYHLDVIGSQLQPRLTVLVDLQDGVAVDASLSPASRTFLRRLASLQNSGGESTYEDDVSVPSPISSSPVVTSAAWSTTPQGEGYLERIEIPLRFDDDFFRLIHADITSLEKLQSVEHDAMAADITTLGHEVTRVTKPSKFSKNDLSPWRELFELYLDAQIFFSTHERNRGAQNSARATQQLEWFTQEVRRRNLALQFKTAGSHVAYDRFLLLNKKMLQNLRFQEINKTALGKILKKFDKRTSLGASGAYLAAIQSRHFMAENVAKDLCANLSQDVVSTVPRLDDYICPVCLSLAWLPVRLKCRHVFCVRCVIKMQRECKRQCPLCRGDVVMQADLENVDNTLIKFLETYFRKETKEKQLANEIERGVELFGPSYRHSSCTLM